MNQQLDKEITRAGYVGRGVGHPCSLSTPLSLNRHMFTNPEPLHTHESGYKKNTE